MQRIPPEVYEEMNITESAPQKVLQPSQQFPLRQLIKEQPPPHFTSASTSAKMDSKVGDTIELFTCNGKCPILIRVPETLHLKPATCLQNKLNAVRDKQDEKGTLHVPGFRQCNYGTTTKVKVLLERFEQIPVRKEMQERQQTHNARNHRTYRHSGPAGDETKGAKHNNPHACLKPL